MLDIMRQDATDTHVTLDDKWFDSLVKIRAPLLLDSLSHAEHDSTLLKRFVEKREPPQTHFPFLSIDKVENAIKQCEALLDCIIHNEKQKAIRELYQQKILEILETQRLLLAVHHKDSLAFREHQTALFGTVNTDTIETIVRPRIESTPRNRSEIRVPDELWYRATKLFPDITLPHNNKHRYHAEEIVSIWNTALLDRFSALKWKAALSTRHFRVTVAARSRTIHIPTTTVMSAAGMRRLFAHEVESHIMRRAAAKRATLKLLRMGTARVHRTEEGLALMAEQLALDSRLYRGVDKYVAVAIATGALDALPKDFSDTYDALFQYFKRRFETLKDPAHAPMLAQKHAWVHTRSLFRASDHHRNDMHFIRGKIYLEGNRAMWEYLATHTDAEFLRLFTGRISPEDFPLLDAIH